MTKMSDINDNEIRVIGGDGGAGHKKTIPWWVWVVICVIAVAILLTVILQQRKPQSIDTTTPPAVNTNTSTTVPTDFWHSNIDVTLPSTTIIRDTLIDSLRLQIFTPYNAIPELHVGNLSNKDTDIVFAALAADVRRDNGKIVGAYVYAGEPLSWGLSKTGYCAIITDKITIGVAENSPFFEQATEQEGYFFRQYPAVKDGVMVKNNPENAAFRRALCVLDGTICIVSCPDRVLINDFSCTLVKLGVSDSIFLVGGTSDGWSRDANGQLTQIGTSITKNSKYNNYIVFRKQ